MLFSLMVVKLSNRISMLNAMQAVVVLLGVVDILFTLLNKEPLEILAAASISITLISIIIGELGKAVSTVILRVKFICLCMKLF